MRGSVNDTFLDGPDGDAFEARLGFNNSSSVSFNLVLASDRGLAEDEGEPDEDDAFDSLPAKDAFVDTELDLEIFELDLLLPGACCAP